MLRKLIVLTVTSMLAKKIFDRFVPSNDNRRVADIKWRPSTPASADGARNPLPRT
jgi:hypothetical protein